MSSPMTSRAAIRAFRSSKAAAAPAAALSRSYATASDTAQKPPHLLSLADLTVPEISTLLQSAHAMKQALKANPVPAQARKFGRVAEHDLLLGRTIALIFSKRSTRTRVSGESAISALGGQPMFLGSADIQLGVNESLLDSAIVISSMVDGIFARVGPHSDVETFAKHSTVPVINALSDLYHPMQILADLLTMIETYGNGKSDISSLRGLTVAWVGDSNNILNDMIVSFARLGINLRIATPKKYPLDERVIKTGNEGLSSESSGGSAAAGLLQHFNDPAEAVKGADILVTDTWVSMGQEAEKAQRLKDFAGYQITSEMAKKGGAKQDWKFMHCLPRKPEEVSDEVFYDEQRSLVFPEAENRKWTAMAAFEAFFGRWQKS